MEIILILFYFKKYKKKHLIFINFKLNEFK